MNLTSSTFGTWSPQAELQRLQRDMNSLFGASAAGELTRRDVPAVNVWLGEDKAVLTAELPGIDPKNLDINVREDTVSIRGTREEKPLNKGEKYLRQERRNGRFSRSFSLPFRADIDKVNAEYRRGVLELTVPRAEEDKPKRIQVKGA